MCAAIATSNFVGEVGCVGMVFVIFVGVCSFCDRWSFCHGCEVMELLTGPILRCRVVLS